MKIREEYKLDDYFKNDNKEFIHGIEPPRKVEQVYHFVDLYDYVNIIPYEPDNKWLFEDFLIRYAEIPNKILELSPTSK